MIIGNLRNSKRMTQREFAALLGVSQQFVSNIETGKRRLSIQKAKKIANALGVDWKQFYE